MNMNEVIRQSSAQVSSPYLSPRYDSTANSNAVSSGNRVSWIDMLRGVAALFVLIVHLEPIPYFALNLINPVMIPLFMLISGYLFRADRPAREFFPYLFRRLVIPLFFISLFPVKVVYDMLRGDLSSLLFRLNQVLSGYNLWYLNCCIVSFLLFYGILRLCRERRALFVLLCCVVSASGFLMAHFGIGNYCKFNTACISQLWLMIGHLLKEKPAPRRWVPYLLTALYFALECIAHFCFPGRSLLDYALNQYFNYPLVLAMILSGVLSLFFFAKSVVLPHFVASPLAFVGQNSLTFYAFHVYCFHAVRRVLSHIPFFNPDFLREFTVFLSACAICSVLSLLINRFAPFLVGNSRRR